MKSLAPFVSLVALATTPVLAQELPPGIDKVLWCASAFYWLAGSAEDSGEAIEAELYDRWSATLLDRAGVSLTANGYPAEAIEALVADYDGRVLDELGADTAPHDVATCPDLLPNQR